MFAEAALALESRYGREWLSTDQVAAAHQIADIWSAGVTEPVRPGLRRLVRRPVRRLNETGRLRRLIEMA